MNEAQTRKELIDKQLQEAGWNVNDRTQVAIDIDSEEWLKRFLVN